MLGDGQGWSGRKGHAKNCRWLGRLKLKGGGPPSGEHRWKFRLRLEWVIVRIGVGYW